MKFATKPAVFVLLALGPVFSVAAFAQAPVPDAHGVLRDKLANGLRVVIIRNALAPVATVQMNFMVGGDETPPGDRKSVV